MYWAETDNFGNVLKLINPLDIEGISRETRFKIVFVKESPDPEKFDGKIKKFFVQDCHIKIREDIDDSIVLKFSSGRCYISNLKPLGMTCEIDIENSSDTLILEKTEPNLIDQELAKSYLSQGSYGFGKIENNSGKITCFKTV
jgi:hypothetical protein